MITRPQLNALLRPGLRTDFRDSYNQHPEEFSRILRVGSMDRAEVEAMTLAGLPRMVKRGEGQAVTYVDPKFSDKSIYLDDEFALGFMATEKAMEDDQYNKVRQSAKWLGRSVRLTQEYAGAAFLDDAFTGAVFQGIFGEALIADDHELLNTSGTWSNLVPGNPQLGVLGLQAAHELAESTVDQNGDPIPMKLDMLIINIADEWAAMQLTMNEDEPYTSDRNINTLKRKGGLSYMISHYKDQTGNDWFARDSQQHDAHFLFRRRPKFTDAMDFDTDSAKFKATQRILVYHYDPRGWIGSNAA